MAYLRWGQSNWYVYHTCESGETYDEQILMCHYMNGETFWLDPEAAESVIKNPKLLDDYAKVVKEEDRKEMVKALEEWLEDLKQGFK